MMPLERTLIQYNWYPCRKRKIWIQTGIEGRPCDDREKTAIFKPGREAFGENNPDDPLMSASQPPEL